MIPWIVLAFLASCSQASRPRGIRAEVTFDQLNTHCWSDFCKSLIRCGEYHQEFASRLLQCTIRALISDVLTGATPFHSSKSTMTTVIARSDDGTPLVYFTVPPNFSINSDFHPTFPLIRMAPTSQAPPPVPTAGSSVRMQDTKPWSFPLAGWVDPGQS